MKKCLRVCVSLVIAFIFADIASAYQPFPDTGQANFYNDEQEIDCPAPGEPFYGQDAQYQPRLPRSYTKLGHGGVDLPVDAAHVDDGGDWIMTRDNVTGLIWEIKTETNKNDTYAWQDARDVFIANLNNEQFGGFSGWRLPHIQELSSLIDYGIDDLFAPSIDKAFFSNPMHPIWSSTHSAEIAEWAWVGGYGTALRHKITNVYVRAVRGNYQNPIPLIDHRNGTVVAPGTGLMWQKATATEKYNWQEALAYAEALILAGYSDWRLPNVNELQTLLDYSKFDPSIDEALSATTLTGIFDSYWSSTTSEKHKKNAWMVGFLSGSVLHCDKAEGYNVRVVRNHTGNDVPDDEMNGRDMDNKDDRKSSSGSGGCFIDSLLKPQN